MQTASTPFLAACTCGVWVTWSVHDYLQERIFRIPGFRFGAFMAFMLQFSSFVLSVLQQAVEWLMETRSRRAAVVREAQRLHEEALDEEQGEAILEKEDQKLVDPVVKSAAPMPMLTATWSTFALYLLLSVLIAASNGCSTAALNYVSMPVKVLFKSGKIVTVMLLGVLCFGRHYALSEYVYMLLVVGGLCTFLLATASGATQLTASLVGVVLLGLAVLADSLVPNVQQKLLATRPKQELIFHTNWMSAVLTFAYMLTTGEAALALAFLARRPRVLPLMLLQALAGYLGILSYLQAVTSFGSKVTVLVTSCRKVFTIGLSAVVFHHALSYYHIVGVSAVFLGVLLNAERERAFSQLLALPALLLTAAIVALQLGLDERIDVLLGVPVDHVASAGAVSNALMPLREALEHRVV